jgi:hypothetical protein
MAATHSTSTPIGTANAPTTSRGCNVNPPMDDLAIIENKTTLELAKQIKYKRILELQTCLHGSAVVKPRPKFRDFFADDFVFSAV